MSAGILKPSPLIYRHNYYAFLWHASFLSLAQNFMDVDTVIPAMLIEAGGILPNNESGRP